MSLLRQPTVLITGATSGIGLALVHAFLDLDARVIAVGRDPGRLARLRASSPAVSAHACDLTRAPERLRLIDNIAHTHPKLSIVINNAAVQHPVDYFAQDCAGLAGSATLAQEEIELNCAALTDLSLRLLPQLRAQSDAALVLVSSGLGFAPKASAPVYCATKAYVHHFAKALRYQVRASAPHIHVMEVIPPLVDTPMTAGRGRAKIAPDTVAAATLAGLRARRDEVNVGKVRLLRAIQRLSPALADRLLRDA